ncbi:hypothetical protein [Methylobacterium aquaticum]|uniref:hypothetical protein n=1 Tax=Methylobacterium aquaticum TaxID=270351 RepID=UPI0019322A4A|nr:hypothetical protein [Methylobacterium aquaticum]QRE76110.1 hypothetical protein F1D61_23350 [Methylobacterium aquaticum]
MRDKQRRSGIERLDGGARPGDGRGDIRIVISGPPAAPKRERVVSYLPWPVRMFLKLGLPVLGFLAVFVLPNYLDCRNQQASGLYFHGMTVAACTRQSLDGQVRATQKRFEDLARAVGAH